MLGNRPGSQAASAFATGALEAIINTVAFAAAGELDPETLPWVEVA